MIGVDVFNYGHLFESNEVHGPIRPCPCPEDYGVSMHPDCCEFVPEDQQPDLDGDGTPDISDANPHDPDIQTQEQQDQKEQELDGGNGNDIINNNFSNKNMKSIICKTCQNLVDFHNSVLNI